MMKENAYIGTARAYIIGNENKNIYFLVHKKLRFGKSNSLLSKSELVL